MQFGFRDKFVITLSKFIGQVGPVSQYSDVVNVLDSAVRRIVKCANLLSVRNGLMGYLCELGS